MARRDRRYRPLPSWMRVVNVMLLPVFYVASMPGYLLAQAEQTAHDVKGAIVESLKPAPPEIKVNRTLPPGVVNDEDAQAASTPSGQNAPALFGSDDPKDEEFFKARLFAEPLVPTEGKASPGENKALAAALTAFRPSSAGKPGLAADAVDQLAPITQFLTNHPGSRWSLALWLNLGVTYRKAGYWTRALDAWEKAWAAGKSATSPNARALADRAVAELAELNARLGRFERLGPLFAELDGSGRELRGAAADKLAGARQGLWMMDNQPEISFRCGPMALNCLRLAADPKAGLEPKLFDAKSTRQGISLSQVAALSRDIDRPMQMAIRSADPNGKGPDFLTPAVVHWKAGHYAALVEQRGDRYRVDDPTFGDTTWVTRAALEAETDGYYLVAANVALPAGWKPVSEAEGNKVWGKGTTGAKDPNATKCNDVRAKPCAECQGGMASYNMEAMLTSLAIGDVPLSYAPPRGSPIGFGVRYSQHEASQPAVFTFWNMGQKWSSDWLSYIEDNGTAIWHIDHWDAHYDPYTNTTTYTPVWVEIGGCVTGPAPVTHLAGGGMEYYQAIDQINNWSYPGIGDDGTQIYFSYASQDQTVAFQFQPIPVYAVNGQVYNPVTNSWVSAYLDPNTYQEMYPFLVRPRLVQTGDTKYKRYLPDGTVETYGHSDQATHYPRRIFLTKRTDPSGNTTTFGYDAYNRLISVKDALGQITTLSYEAADTLKVTKVTDPFGRSCHLDYNDAGQLDTITDTAGIQSFFTYQAGGDFIDSLTTPYGTTTFAFADVTTDPGMGVAAWLEATDPYGDTERAEFRHNAPGIPFSEGIVPGTIPTFNAYINARNTYYWDKKAYKEARQGDGSFDYTKAKIMHFLHSTDTNVCSGVLESTKQPLENRVWLAYQGQTWAGGISNGMSQQPSMVARVLDDGSTQLYQYQYNDQQRITQATDPLGRQITYNYDPANNLDLLAVRRTTGGLNEYLSGATYNDKHQPLTTTNAAGQTTILTYNDYGQLTSTQDPAGRTVGFQYDGGYLKEIDGFDPSIKSTFTYDGFGRLASTTTYPDAYTVQVGYDAAGGNPLATLNRPVTSTYPDGSYTEVDYTNLSAEWLRDRGGNWTHVLTNKLRQTEAVISPVGSVTQYGYCKCGQLVAIIDPNNHVTQWKLDSDERRVSKIYADGTEVAYTYENTTSRLKTVTDAKGQQANYNYYLDGALQSVSYTNAVHPTSGVSYTYDPARGRVTTIADGIGTTTYNYYPLGSGSYGNLGAGKLQSVSGPFANETIAYQYDQLGRVTTRTTNGIDETYGFDSLGRLQTDANALGTFTYGYDGTTSRLSSASYPNGQQALCSYFEDNTRDRRLSQIKHLTPAGATLDQFDYTYDGPLGRISHWGQQQPGAVAGSMASSSYDLSYDPTGQLRRVLLNNDATNSGSSVWSYDAAGNRTGEQSGSGTLSTAVPTPTNALFSLKGGGQLRVAGSLSEWAQVSVNGRVANLDAGNNEFEVSVPLATGTQTLSISATDASGNTATNRYELAISAGAAASFGYDTNGNTVSTASAGGGSSPAQGFEWDACNRVTAINLGSHRTEFGYDGTGKRVRITEKDGGNVTTDRLYVANEERDAVTGQVLRRLFTQGEQWVGSNNPGNYFYANDHLGSTRVFTDGAGNVRASYGYSLWGSRAILQSGGLDTESGFTGYWHHNPSGLDLSATRLYSPAFGRFISKDPLLEDGGLNLYRYCGNNPASRRDPAGLVWGMDWLDNPAYDNFFQGAADFSSGFGSVATFGASDWVEDELGLSPSINKCSWSYKGGEAAAFLVGLLDGESEEEAAAAGERCLFGCFVAGTLIDTAKGQMPVESVQPGDLVWSRDVEKDSVELRPVTNTFHRTSSDELDVALSDGETVHTTPGHPFWVVGVGWCHAAKLVEGEQLLTADRHTVTVEKITVLTGKSNEVYNLELEHAHTYFVGEGKVLVHNACSGAQAAEELAASAEEVRAALDPIAYQMRTVAALESDAGRILAGGARDLSPAQRAVVAANGDIAAALPGAHAEMTALHEAVTRDLVPKAMEVTRDICPECAAMIERAGGQLIGPRSVIFPNW